MGNGALIGQAVRQRRAVVLQPAMQWRLPCYCSVDLLLSPLCSSVSSAVKCPSGDVLSEMDTE